MKYTGRRRLIVLLLFALSIMACSAFSQRGRYQVVGESNAPTYSDGDWLTTEKVDLINIKRGDFVVLDNPVESIIQVKRIIALPGKKVEIVDGKVSIDGKELAEAYLAPAPGTKSHGGQASWTIGANELFVMGDNRAGSQDSRFWGPIDYKLVRGRVIKD